MKKRRNVIIFVTLLIIFCLIVARNLYPIDAVRSFGELPYTHDGYRYEIKGNDSAYLLMYYLGYPDTESFIIMNINADPFAEAGLSYKWRCSNVITDDNSFGEGFAEGFSTNYGNVPPAEALKDYIKQNRKCLTYISDEARYRITFPLGAFEWAKDITKTTEDIVFIVCGPTMIKNGVNPYSVDGWIYDAENNWFVKSFDVG